MGFSKPENVRLYGYGGHRIDETLKNVYEDLEEVPLYYNATHDNWLFWANGLLYWDGNERVFNPYANEACYFLTEADSPSVLTTAPPPTGSVRQTYESFTDHLLYEKDDFAWFTVGRNLYDAQNFSGGGSRTYKFTTVNSLGNELLTVAFTAGAESRTTLKTSVNGNALPEQTLSATSKYIYATAANRTTDVSKYAAGAEAIRELPQADTLHRLLLCDSDGQHKLPKAQRRLKAAEVEAIEIKTMEVPVIPQGAAATDIDDYSIF